MTEPHIAHVRQLEDGTYETQSIDEHCHNVAVLARDFMYEDEESKGLKDLAYMAGLLHDFGKYRRDFQRYIMLASGMDATYTSAPRAPHAIVGAIEAEQLYGGVTGRILAYCISGHHRGLYDYPILRGALRNSQHIGWKSECENSIRGQCLTDKPLPRLPEFRGLHMVARMIFSSLIDADRIDTEKFMAPSLGYERSLISNSFADVAELREKLKIMTDTFRESPRTSVNEARAYFLDQCRKHGESHDSGIYTLSLPTGSGKTLSSMAWALEMAIRNGHRRIIYAIPYTSILTQTAETFRKVFGDENILEHHSEITFDEKKDDFDQKLSRLKFLSENWDAPIVLTTNVQFFESLFSSNPSKCRKLHNITNSVIILDEAQSLPDSFLAPILKSIQQLSDVFHCSVLLCTATQPVYSTDLRSENSAKKFFTPLKTGGEIVRREERYFAPFSRVNYHLDSTKKTAEELASALAKDYSVLCVVNSRKDAQHVYSALRKILGEERKGEIIHLSRMMCSAHLKVQIDLIKKRLQDNLPTKVISTQLIEAGVDLDFPCVWRASAGLGSIIQAAGRCNREGKLKEKGEVFVFDLIDSKPVGSIAIGRDAMLSTVDKMKSLGLNDPTQPSVIEYYYEQYFRRPSINFDSKNICNSLLLSKCNFEEVSEKFKLIDDTGTFTVIVPYSDEGATLVLKISSATTLSKNDYRLMQQYSVSLRKKDFLSLLGQGSIEQIGIDKCGDSILYILSDKKCYKDYTGVVVLNHWADELQTV